MKTNLHIHDPEILKQFSEYTSREFFGFMQGQYSKPGIKGIPTTLFGIPFRGAEIISTDDDLTLFAHDYTGPEHFYGDAYRRFMKEGVNVGIHMAMAHSLANVSQEENKELNKYMAAGGDIQHWPGIKRTQILELTDGEFHSIDVYCLEDADDGTIKLVKDEKGSMPLYKLADEPIVQTHNFLRLFAQLREDRNKGL